MVAVALPKDCVWMYAPGVLVAALASKILFADNDMI
jgi:hypothetical protein